MPRNFFITGLPKSGKTTLLRRIINELRKQGLRVGGIITPEEKVHGTRNGFEVMDVATGKQGMLADIHGDGPKISKYHVDLRSFEGICIPAFYEYKKRFDVVVIDEIGRMELRSDKFQECLDEIIDSHVPLIASLHNDFVTVYGYNGDVFVISENSRESVYNELVNTIKREYASILRPGERIKINPLAGKTGNVKKPNNQTIKKSTTVKKRKHVKKSNKKTMRTINKKTKKAISKSKTKNKTKGRRKTTGKKTREPAKTKKGIVHHVKHHVKNWFGL